VGGAQSAAAVPIMMAPGYDYVDTAIGGVRNRNRVMRRAAFAPSPDAVDCFTTYCRFTVEFAYYAEKHPSPSTGQPPSVAGYPGAAWASFFTADFDDRADPGQAIADAVACLGRWEREYGLSPDDVRIFWSGMKGIALEIPGQLFGGFEPNEEIGPRFEHMAEHLLHGAATADYCIYEKLRLWRVPNTRHGVSRLFKIPLSWNELRVGDLESIRALAGEPRQLDQPADEGQDALPGLVRLWRETTASAPSARVLNGTATNGLAGAPAVGDALREGERNSTLASLAGTMRRRGMGEEAMAAALLVENKNRCVPPLDEAEVRRIAASIARYEPAEAPRNGTVIGAEMSIGDELPAWEPRWLLTPEERDQAERHSWLDDYIAYASQRTDAPREFHEALGLVVLSAIIGRGAVLHLAVGDVYPILWVLILADSSLHRKSTALDLARDLVERVDRELLAPNDFTPQRFVAILAEHDGYPLLFIRDEFSGFYEGLNKLDYMGGLKETLCNVYDGRPFHREKMKPKGDKAGTVKADEWRFDVRKPFLAMAVATTMERFSEVARVGDLHSGFLPRYALVLPPEQSGGTRPLTELTEASEQLRQVLVGRLSELWAQAVKLQIAPEVLNRFNQYVADMEDEARAAPNPNLVAIVGARIVWMALRVAMLLAVADDSQWTDGTRFVTMPHLLRGIVLAEGWRRSAIQMLGALAPSQFERRAGRVVQLVAQKKEIARRDIMRALHISKRDMDDLQATLAERGEVIVEHRQLPTGQSIWYRAPRVSQVSQVSPRGVFDNSPAGGEQDAAEELVEWQA
jgi:hypothetical protein